jgi:hypothetical protein
MHEHGKELEGNGRDGTWRELACISGNWMLLQPLVGVDITLRHSQTSQVLK